MSSNKQTKGSSGAGVVGKPGGWASNSLDCRFVVGEIVVAPEGMQTLWDAVQQIAAKNKKGKVHFVITPVDYKNEEDREHETQQVDENLVTNPASYDETELDESELDDLGAKEIAVALEKVFGPFTLREFEEETAPQLLNSEEEEPKERSQVWRDASTSLRRRRPDKWHMADGMSGWLVNFTINDNWTWQPRPGMALTKGK